MPARTAAVVAVLALAFGGMPLGVAQVEEGTVVGQPTIEVVAEENELEWGANETVRLTIANAGRLIRGGPERFEERVTTARNVRVSILTDRLEDTLVAGLEIDDGRSLLAGIEAGETATATFGMDVRKSLNPGRYELPVLLQYEYVATVDYGSSDPVYTTRQASTVVRVPLVVEDQPRLNVSAAQTTGIPSGGTGQYPLRITNEGTQAATNVGVVLHVDDTAVYLGSREAGGTTTALFVDRLAPGETRTLTVTAGAYDGASAGVYRVNVTSTYQTPGGITETSQRERIGLSVNATDYGDPNDSAVWQIAS